MGRFDYVKYDEKSLEQQKAVKAAFEDLELIVDSALGGSRAKALVLTKLEEAYMWCGKGIRDAQLDRRVAELQEERKNG